MNVQHRIQLVDLLRELELPLVAAEIGVAEGRFSLELLQAGIEKLLLIDRWKCYPDQKGDGSSPQDWHDKNYQDMQDRLYKYTENILIYKGDSGDMSHQVTQPLSMVYIDADHSYEGVSRDLNLWYGHVVHGGIIAGHDYLNNDYGVYKAVHDFCVAHNYTPIVIPENNSNDSSFYFIKH